MKAPVVSTAKAQIVTELDWRPALPDAEVEVGAGAAPARQPCGTSARPRARPSTRLSYPSLAGQQSAMAGREHDASLSWSRRGSHGSSFP